MATHKFVPLLGKRIRVTTLDKCGVPLAAGTEDAVLATDGFVSITLSSEVEDGQEIISKKADGSLCVNEKFASSFKRFNVEITFCGVNPALVSMVTNAVPYEDAAGDIAGFTVGEGKIEKVFALELWTGIAGVACTEGGEASGYLLLPFVQAGVPGNIEITGEAQVDFQLTGSYTKGGNAWGVGPFNVISDGTTAGKLPTALDEMDHLLLVDTSIAPPPSADDPQPMPTAA